MFHTAISSILFLGLIVASFLNYRFNDRWKVANNIVLKHVDAPNHHLRDKILSFLALVSFAYLLTSIWHIL